MSLTVAQRGAVQQQQQTRRRVPVAPVSTGSVLGVDVSNYTGPLTQDDLALWWAKGIRLVIIQAFPANMNQYANQLQQMTACSTFGMPFECYIYDYLATPGWRDGALAGLWDAPWRKGRVWADEEDTSSTAMLVSRRVSAVASTLGSIAATGYEAGIYTGLWFWQGYMGNTPMFSAYPLWDSNYDNVPDANVGFVPYGGWTHATIKQYHGTTTLEGVPNVDLNVTAG